MKFFSEIILEIIFFRPLIPLLWTSCDVFFGSKGEGGFLHLSVLSLACDRFFKFTSGATPVALLALRLAAEPLYTLLFLALIGVELVQLCGRHSL